MPVALSDAQKSDHLDFYVRLNRTGASGVPYGFDGKYTVGPMPSVRQQSVYTSSGFIGMQSIVNEFLNCGGNDDETNLNPNCFAGEKFALKSPVGGEMMSD
jgi:hypothetical protein